MKGSANGSNGKTEGGSGNGHGKAAVQIAPSATDAATTALLNRLATRTESAPAPTPSEQFALFQEDAPSCDNCGAITVRAGNCYLCHNCGRAAWDAPKRACVIPGGIHESVIAAWACPAKLPAAQPVRNEALGASPRGYLNNSRFFHESHRST